MSKPDFRIVDTDEFNRFVSLYPGQLVRDTRPDQITLNDFTNNRRWPDSIVAKRPNTDSAWAIIDLPLGEGLPA